MFVATHHCCKICLPQIAQVAREGRCLATMLGLEIPEQVKLLLLREKQMKVTYDKVCLALDERARVIDMVRPTA